MVRSTKGESWLEEREAGPSPANLVPLTSRRAKPNFSFYLSSILKQPQATLADNASLRLSHAACSNFETSNLTATSGGKNTRPPNPEPRPPPILRLSQLPILDLPCERSKHSQGRLYQLGVKPQVATMTGCIKVRALSCEPCESHMPRETRHLCMDYATLLPGQRGRRSALRCVQIMQPYGTVQIRKSSGWASSSESSAR